MQISKHSPSLSIYSVAFMLVAALLLRKGVVSLLYGTGAAALLLVAKLRNGDKESRTHLLASACVLLIAVLNSPLETLSVNEILPLGACCLAFSSLLTLWARSVRSDPLVGQYLGMSDRPLRLDWVVGNLVFFFPIAITVVVSQAFNLRPKPIAYFELAALYFAMAAICFALAVWNTSLMKNFARIVVAVSGLLLLLLVVALIEKELRGYWVLFTLSAVSMVFLLIAYLATTHQKNMLAGSPQHA